ncbi:MAG: threonylcarbamoyl-AMP synthase [Desulfobacca sp. 4484_104]|nr:MAG: threonylcarbamoyl-AMP synthase [Desulfobacca sp. 4484_104]RLA89591.1 MAG: threonylcarbamoyl-AMP synthase [Deltaproteobacteria bacterium]
MARLVTWHSPADRASLEEALTIIRRGGIVACPTETYYGLAVDAFQETALARLLALKGRPVGKPLLVLVADLDMVELVALIVPPLAQQLMARFWPGPLTLVLPARPDLPGQLTAGTGTIGVRQSGHPLALSLTAAYGRPLTGTSANRAGQPPVVSAVAVEREMGLELDLIMDSGPCFGGLASTVLDLSQEPPRLIRVGAIPKRVLETLIDLP